jgi:hypothetical protein
VVEAVERLYHIVAALFYMRDYAPALAADLSREVRALTMRLEQNAKGVQQ